MAGSAGAIRAGRAYVELFTKDSITKGLIGASKKLKAWGASITALGSSMLASDALQGAAFLGAAKLFADMGSAMQDMSERTGVSVEELSELGYAAEQSGASMEDLEKGLRHMMKAGTGGGGSPSERFKRIAQELAGIEDPGKRVQRAIELLGKSGAMLLPMVGSVETLTDRARKLGIVMSSEDAKAADEFGDALGDLWKVLKMGAFHVGAALAPELMKLVGFLTTAGKAAMDWIRQNKGLIVTVAALTFGAIALDIAIIALGITLTAIGAILGAAATAFGIIWSAIAAIASPVGIALVAIAALGAGILYWSGAGGKILKWLGEQFAWLKGHVLSAWEGISDALKAGDIQLAAKIAWASIKLIFLEGTLSIQNTWIDMVAALKQGWLEVEIAVRKGFATILAWGEQFLTMLGTSWVELESVAKIAILSMETAFTFAIKRMQTLFQTFATATRALWGVMFGGEEPSQALSVAQTAVGAVMAGAGIPGAAARDKLEEEREARMAEIEGERDAAKNRADNRIQALKDELEQLKKEAKEKAEMVQRQRGGGPILPGEVTAVGRGAMGTFEAGAVSRLFGRDDKQDQTNRLLERAVKHLGRIEDKGGMNFA